ncbi:MAG: transporter substrate-binding domain-containing protein [Pseudomonadales bacterium]|nr:transporter substrate-binding domain-containing protein [Pseudomonadales bacterium]
MNLSLRLLPLLWSRVLLFPGQILLLVLPFTATMAIEKITVVSDEWHNYAEQDGTGYYFDLLRAIYPETQYHLEFSIVPYSRSLYLVEYNKANIVLGIYQGELADARLSQYVIERDLVDALVTPELANKWQGPESLTGEVVIAKLGYGFDKVTEIKMVYVEQPKVINMVKMLKARRVSAILDYEEDLKAYIDEGGLGSAFKIKKSVLAVNTYFGFSGDAQGKSLQSRFNSEFKRLWDSGKIQALLLENTGSLAGLPENP